MKCIDQLGRGSLILWLLLFGGCLGSCRAPSAPLPTYFTQGQVFIRGKPAAGALVVLQPAQRWRCGYPHAIADERGEFVISTFADCDGAPAGDYIAVIRWFSGSAAPAGDDPESAAQLAQQQAGDEVTFRLPVTVQPGPRNILPRFELR